MTDRAPPAGPAPERAADMSQPMPHRELVKCWQCRYFEYDGTSSGNGKCHLKSAKQGGKFGGEWPRVISIDWCGEGVKIGSMSALERIAAALEGLYEWHKEPQE